MRARPAIGPEHLVVSGSHCIIAEWRGDLEVTELCWCGHTIQVNGTGAIRRGTVPTTELQNRVYRARLILRQTSF